MPFYGIVFRFGDIFLNFSPVCVRGGTTRPSGHLPLKKSFKITLKLHHIFIQIHG